MSERATAQQQDALSPALTPVGSSILQRRCACGGVPGPTDECAECRNNRLGFQRKVASQAAAPSIPPIVHDVLRSPGQPLDAQARAFMEPRFGHDFSRVRVHVDEKAAESARAVGALAYTVGRDVVFGEGHYAPETREGRRLLAHELAHVVQQNGRLIASSSSLSVGPPDTAEAEAQGVADRVVDGALVTGTIGQYGGEIQRQTAPVSTERRRGQTLPYREAMEEQARNRLAAGDASQPGRHPGCDSTITRVPDPQAMIEQARATAITWVNAVIPMVSAAIDAPESWQGTIASGYLDRHFHCPSQEQLDYIRMTLQAIGALLPELPVRCTNDPDLCRSNERYYPVPFTYAEVFLCPAYFTMNEGLRAQNLLLRTANMFGRMGECYVEQRCYGDFSIPASVMVNNGTNYSYFAREASGARSYPWPATIPCVPRQPATGTPEEPPPQAQRLCQEAGRPTSRTVVLPTPPGRPFVQVGSGPASGRLLEERHDASGNFVCDRGRRIDQTW